MRKFVSSILYALVFFLFPVCHTPSLEAAEKNDYWEEVGIVRIGEKKPVQAPDFTLNALDGKKVSLKDFRGKVVFLNFWATWCPPCKTEMPAMNDLYMKFRDKGFVVLAIDAGEEAKKVKEFIVSKGYAFPVLLDRDGSVAGDLYKVIGLPTTFLINRKGMVVGKAEGAREWESEGSFKLVEELLQ